MNSRIKWRASGRIIWRVDCAVEQSGSGQPPDDFRREKLIGVIVPEERYTDFVDGREVIFRPIHPSQFHEYLGCANWFYRPLGSAFPALQCVWPDLRGRFPHEDGFDTRFSDRQIDLSQPRI